MVGLTVAPLRSSWTRGARSAIADRMSALGYYHPIVVHFAIALFPVGVLLRVVWLVLKKRAAFANTAATVLILLAALSSVVAAKTGHDAHRPVEHMPGGGPPLGVHQQWGEWARDVFLGAAALEIAALVLLRRDRERQAIAAAALSGAVGLAGVYCVVRAGNSGGTLVYSYAGGVGMRTENPEDVRRLLLAGMVHNARADRAAGKKAEAAELMDLAGRRYKDDPEVRLLAAESLLLDKGDAAGALEALRKLDEPEAARGLRFRRRLLTADALAASGQREEALTALRRMRDDYPQAGVVKQHLEALEKGGAAPPAK
jgi:uncharacterized membrane protein